MSKISPATNVKAPVNLPQKSAWSKGPPSIPSAAASSSQSVNVTPVASAAASNGYQAHSRRGSAVVPMPQQGSSALKGAIAVSKAAVAAPASKGISNVQFGSIDDTSAPPSTSPAAPSALTDPKQVKAFGTISATTKPATVSASPIVSKTVASLPSGQGSSSTASTSASQAVKKKIDIHKLFQQPSGGASEPTPTPAPSATPTANPASSQDPVPPRPSAIQQSSYETNNARNSPSVRPAPLPQQTGQPGGIQQNGSVYAAPHLRQQPNGVGSPRSPNFSRGMNNNGSMRGPPGTQPGVLGSPRMGPPPAPQQQMAPPPNMAGMPNPMPNGAPVGVPHPPGQVAPPVPGQVPHAMSMQGMQPMMPWGGPYTYYGYYPPPFDQNMPQPFWPGQPGQIPPHMQQPPQPQPTPQQAPMQLHPMPPTPSQSQVPISPRPSPAISLNSTVPPTPSTPSMHTPTTNSRLQSTAAPFQPQAKRAISISLRKPDGEALDLKALAAKKDEDAARAKKEEGPATLERRPVAIRLETEEANKKRLEDEKKKEELAKVKAKRDAEAAERKKRDDEERERRKREEEDRERKKEEQERHKREEEEEKKRAEERRLEEEQVRLEAERLEKARVEKERLENERLEKERLEKERLEKERLEKERLEQERLEKERLEQERLEKARLEQEEQERKERERKEAEEQERLRKEAEEQERIRLEKEAEEARRKAEEEAERKAKEAAKAEAEAEAAAAAMAAKEAATSAVATPSATAGTPADGTPAASSPAPSTPAYGASPASGTASLPKPAPLEPKRARPVPGRLDLSSTTNPNLPQPLPSALASARIIEDIDKVSYPEGIKAPKSELNVNAASGKFRYDRDFLLQFMSVCKDKPDDLPPLDAIGLEPTDQSTFTKGGRFRPGPQPGVPSAQASRNSIGLGLMGPGGGSFTGKTFGNGGMGNFQPRSSEDRFAAATAARNLGGGNVPFPRQPLPRTASRDGSLMQNQPSPRDGLGQRPRSGRGGKRDSLRGPPPSQLGMAPVNAEPVELLPTENRWTATRGRNTVDENSPEYVDRKVKALLNKLTLEKFESISKQILEWANRSVNETDGRTLIQVIRLVFEKATDEATWSEMYARLCRFLMERISPDVRDDSIRNNQDGKPIAGGNLFRKYLLNRCQEDFERGWSVKEAANAAAASKAEEDKAAADAAEKAGGGEEVLYSDEYYAAQKAKRRGLGLVKFIGELFKLQMLTERIMHECIKKLLSNVENPEEEEIESLCKLLATVGQTLDTPKARNHMDIYFSRMKELAHGGKISSRIQFMILDVIELRTRSWVTRNQVAAPTTIAEVHEKAARDRAVQEREALLRQSSVREPAGRGRRDTGRGDYGPPQVGADGWTTPVTRPVQTKAGDLSKFGKIDRSAGLQFGPSSVFSKRGEKRESASVTRVSSSSNMFAMLNSSEATPDAASVGSRTAASTRPPSRKASIDMGSGTASPIDGPPQRRRLVLQPRSVPFGEGSVKEGPPSTVATSDYGEEETASNAGGSLPAMSLERAKQKITEDVKELFMLRDLNEGEGYFESLPVEFRNELVEALFHKAIDAKESDVQLVVELFGRIASKNLAAESHFEKGFEVDMEFLEDISVDVPQVYTTVAKLMHAAKLSNSAIERLAGKIAVEGDLAVTPKDKLLKHYATLA